MRPTSELPTGEAKKSTVGRSELSAGGNDGPRVPELEG